MKNRVGVWMLAAAAVGLSLGCDEGGSDDAADAAAGGGAGGAGGGGGELALEAYYSGLASASLGAEGNEVRCATCHSNDGTQAGYAGNSLADIAHHTSFKGGAAPTLLDGANACVTGWMGGTALTAEDPAWQSLEAYLLSISDEAVTEPNPIAPEVLADEAAYEAAYAGGDGIAGEAKFAAVCGRCHVEELQVGDRAAYAPAVLGAFTVGRIAQKVRTSGPPPSGTNDATDSTPGPMPFFEEQDLSSEDLADIIAYLGMLGG